MSEVVVVLVEELRHLHLVVGVVVSHHVVLVLHAFADAARVSFTALGHLGNYDLWPTMGIGVLTFSTVVLSHELLVLLIVLLSLISLAHDCVLLLEGVVVSTLELGCIVVSSVKAVIELALISWQLIVAVAAAHFDFFSAKVNLKFCQFEYI